MGVIEDWLPDLLSVGDTSSGGGMAQRAFQYRSLLVQPTTEIDLMMFFMSVKAWMLQR